jgi:diphthamide biosynthesis protein 2
MMTTEPDCGTKENTGIGGIKLSGNSNSVLPLLDAEKEIQSPYGLNKLVSPEASDLKEAAPPGDRSDDSTARNRCENDGAQLEQLPSAATTVDFPEGGVKGWLVVLGSFCAMLSLFGLINSAAVFESYFSTNQLVENTPSEIGWIFSLYLFIVFFVGIQVGPIFDRFGARALVAVGSLLIVLSLLLLSWCDRKCPPFCTMKESTS